MKQRNLFELLVDIYIVDDASTDGTYEAIANEFPNIILIRGNGNLYWNRGMYYCWQKAIQKHHDFYLWLNDDTMLYEDAFDILFECVDVDNSIIVGCCNSSTNKNETTYGAREKGIIVQPNGNVQIVSEINGNVVLIPNEVVEKIGIIDPYYQHSVGDNEYGYRAQKNGYKCLLSPMHIGVCDRHDTVKKSYNPNINIIDRVKALNTPFGPRPKEEFHLRLKYFGFINAFFSVLYIYIKCFFPKFHFFKIFK